MLLCKGNIQGAFMKYLCSLFAIFSLYAENFQIIQDKNDLVIESPALKEQNTLKMQLANGMQAYIISDPGANQSAIALAVEVGSWDDLNEYPGIAHFCEHMLFMGSEKYPEESHFTQKVFDSQGTYNAYTAPNRTVYMFSSNHEAFRDNVDIFAQFFINPLFREDAVHRELLAVDQEYQKNLEHDGWREHMVMKELCDDVHPNKKFSTGNKDTLRPISLETLRNWYRLHYAANHMHLVIYTNQDIQSTQEFVLKTFSEVPPANPPKQKLTPLFSTQHRGKIISLTPVKNLKKISFYWEMDSETALDISGHSVELIAYVLSHKENNGLYQKLRSLGYIEGIEADNMHYNKECEVLGLDIQLTDDGLSHKEEVMDITFSYIQKLEEEGICHHVFDEYKKMRELNYKWQSRRNEFSLVEGLASKMIHESFDTFPKKHVTPTSYKPQKIHNILSTMQPKNTLVTLLSDPKSGKFEPDSIEKWHQVPYCVDPLPQKILAKTSDTGELNESINPKKNPFIPDKTRLYNQTQGSLVKEPNLVAEGVSGKCFFAEDKYYLIPKASLDICCKSPLLYSSVDSLTMLDLVMEYCQDKLSSLSSQGDQAGLSTHISLDTDFTFRINVTGYDEKIDRYALQILETIQSTSFTEKEFLQYKSSLSDTYANKDKSLSVAKGMEILKHILFNDSFTGQQHQDALASINSQDFSTFLTSFFQKAYTEVLVYGNCKEDKARSLWKKLHQTVGKKPYLEKEHEKTQALSLAYQKKPTLVQVDHALAGDATLLAIDCNKDTPESIALQGLLVNPLHNAFFEELRSKQQTGYIVRAQALQKAHNLYLVFYVHSTSHGAEDLLSRFHVFTENFAKDVREHISKERFYAIQSNLISQYTKPPKNLFDKSKELFAGAFVHKDFYRKDQIVQALRKISYEQFISYAQKTLAKDNPQRLAILVKGSSAPELSYDTVNIENFKNSSGD